MNNDELREKIAGIIRRNFVFHKEGTFKAENELLALFELHAKERVGEKLDEFHTDKLNCKSCINFNEGCRLEKPADNCIDHNAFIGIPKPPEQGLRDVKEMLNELSSESMNDPPDYDDLDVRKADILKEIRTEKLAAVEKYKKQEHIHNFKFPHLGKCSNMQSLW